MRIKNVLGIAKAVMLAHITGKVTPVNVMWRVTNKCNLKCSYCNVWHKVQKELTREQILSLIDQMVECGTQRLGFVGGEALLRKDFGQIVSYAKKKGLYVTLVSNGSTVPKNMSIIKNLDCLVLSFDGKKENHERGRAKGSFNNLIRAFEACKDNSIKVLTNTVLNKHNLSDIGYILNTTEKYGFSCTFNLLQTSNSNCYPPDSQYRKALDYLIKRKKEGAPIVLSLKTMNFLKDWPDYKKFITQKKVKGVKCWAGKLIFNVNSDGKIAGCDILTHVKKDNPSCLELGFEKAYKSVETDGCAACTCAHVLEYNHIFSLSPSVILDWSRII